MDIGTCTITFGDGTTLLADRNGDVFRTESEIDERFFTDERLSDVSVEMVHGADEIFLGECGYNFWGLVDEMYEFALTRLTQEQKAAKIIQQAMSDISDAILEMSEIVYGEE